MKSKHFVQRTKFDVKIKIYGDVHAAEVDTYFGFQLMSQNVKLIKLTSSIRSKFTLYLRIFFSTCAGRSSGLTIILSKTSAGSSGIMSSS